MSDSAVRRAALADAKAVGRLLHDFNTEFDEPTPSPDALYESLGFSNREGRPDGPLNYSYERRL